LISVASSTSDSTWVCERAIEVGDHQIGDLELEHRDPSTPTMNLGPPVNWYGMSEIALGSCP